ncbi:MAG TPA: 3-deoxy-7-phosphoheptulonate synthase, partial [Candidatus Paenibacillus intestinavium]|nr:3-deoxy-7-phosphoheptulonate synthase [Candidatus Paenibacillus intestinavium]
MIVITKNNVSDERISEIVACIERKDGMQAHVSKGTDRTVIGIIGQADSQLGEQLRAMKDVDNVIKISKSYKLASRDFHPDDT